MVVSDEQGGYRFHFLPPGTYTLKFELPGFRVLAREGIQMTAGFTATLNVSLEVGVVSETVTVAGELSPRRWRQLDARLRQHADGPTRACIPHIEESCHELNPRIARLGVRWSF